MNSPQNHVFSIVKQVDAGGLPVEKGSRRLERVACAGAARRMRKPRPVIDFESDTLMQGWMRALEERECETASHCRRVVEKTVQLAAAMGVEEKEWIHFQRGALLHDIGKMGIPNSILLKPGPLTEAEWEIMRMHPVYAYRLIAPIPYLAKALTIPYCHHEKWDGSGYPRGLKGEQIPLAARIFSVVDVYDALTSERPYNRPWPVQEVKAYLRTESGRMFDPRVVKVFLALLDQETSHYFDRPARPN